MKPGCLAALWLLSLAALALPASADLFTGDVHTTVTVIDTQYWSGIEVKDGEAVEYTVKVQSGDIVNVHLMDDAQLSPFLSGSLVPTVHSEEDTTSSSYTHSSAGKYCLMIDNGYGNSVCKVDIVVRSAGLWETGTGCMVIVVLVAIISVAVVIVVVVALRRRRPATQPPQAGAPGPQYGGPAYQPQGAQYPAQAPAHYPAAAPEYPPAQQQYQARPGAGYQPATEARYQPPPAPPQVGAPAAPAAPPQPPAAPPAAPGQTAVCKYCDFQMPAGTQICPRCGGFN